LSTSLGASPCHPLLISQDDTSFFISSNDDDFRPLVNPSTSIAFHARGVFRQAYNSTITASALIPLNRACAIPCTTAFTSSRMPDILGSLLRLVITNNSMRPLFDRFSDNVLHLVLSPIVTMSLIQTCLFAHLYDLFNPCLVIGLRYFIFRLSCGGVIFGHPFYRPRLLTRSKYRRQVTHIP